MNDMHPHQSFAAKTYDQWQMDAAVSTAKDSVVKNTKAAIKLVRLATLLGADLPNKKIALIKLLRESENIGLKEAKDAIELAIELRPAA